MAYDKEEILQKCIKAIEEYKCTTFDEMSLYVEPSRETLYQWGFHNIIKIKEKLNNNIFKNKHYIIDEKIKNLYQKGNGYVYLIHCKGTNYYKIGVSKLPTQNRLSNLQSGCPFELEMLHIQHCWNYYVIEKQIHKILKEKNIRGEWFEIEPKDLTKIILLIDSAKSEQLMINFN